MPDINFKMNPENGKLKEKKLIKDTKRPSNMISRTSTTMLQDQAIQEASISPTLHKLFNIGEMPSKLIKTSERKLPKMLIHTTNKLLHKEHNSRNRSKHNGQEKPKILV